VRELTAKQQAGDAGAVQVVEAALQQLVGGLVAPQDSPQVVHQKGTIDLGAREEVSVQLEVNLINCLEAGGSQDGAVCVLEVASPQEGGGLEGLVAVFRPEGGGLFFGRFDLERRLEHFLVLGLEKRVVGGLIFRAFVEDLPQ
jgi:hypothetical protein